MYAVKEEGKSDVCVYYSYDGYLVCADCDLNKEKYSEFATTEDICNHLNSHEERGDLIPENLIREIWEDDRQNFWWLKVDSYPEDWDEDDGIEWYEKCDGRDYY